MKPINSDTLLSAALVFYGFMACLAAFIAWLRGSNDFIAPLGAWEALWGVSLGIAIALLSRPLRFFEGFDSLYKAIFRLLGPLSSWSCAALALSSGFAEEALFRGALQPWLGLYPAALIFAALHSPALLGEGEDDLKRCFRIWPLFALVVGIGFGYLTVSTETWLSAALAHITVNYLNLRYICGREGLNAGSRSKDDSGLS